MGKLSYHSLQYVANEWIEMVPSYPLWSVILVFVLCPSEHASSHLGYLIGRRWSHFYSSFCDGCDGRLVRPMVLTKEGFPFGGIVPLGCTHTTVRLMVLTMGFSGGWLSFPDSQSCLASFPAQLDVYAQVTHAHTQVTHTQVTHAYACFWVGSPDGGAS